MGVKGGPLFYHLLNKNYGKSYQSVSVSIYRKAWQRYRIHKGWQTNDPETSKAQEAQVYPVAVAATEKVCFDD